MNFKTTIGMAIAVIVVSGAYLGWNAGRSAGSKDAGVAQIDPAADSSNAKQPDEQERMLAQPPFADDTRLVKVVYEKRGKPRMVFERGDDDAKAAWQLVEPTNCKASNWMVDNIGLVVKRLKYASKSTIGEPGTVSLEDAGLRPKPAARFVVTSEDGETVEVEIGNTLIGNQNAYVYLPSRPNELFVSAEEYGNILDRGVVEFREKRLFEFDDKDVVELRVTELKNGEKQHYTLVKKDEQWRFTAPFKAKADTKKIDEVVRGFKRQWVREWLEAAPENPADYGLSDPHLQLTVITEKEIKVEAVQEIDSEAPTTQPTDTDDEPDVETTIEREEYVLFVSDRKPIDDSSVLYVKKAAQEQVGMINAADAGKYVPRVSEWRDMDVIEANATGADSIEIVLADARIKLQLRDKEWVFEDSQDPAEPEVVASLLKRLDELKAVNFVDDVQGLSLGLDQPAAVVTMTFADGSDSQTLRIGEFTESVEKRLRYVRRVGASAVAKVRASDLESILQGVDVYRNREIMDVADARIMKLELSRFLPAKNGKQDISLDRDENKVWRMAAPISSEVNLKPVNDLVSRLAKLRGIAVIDEPDLAKLGLDEPQIEVSVTIEAIPIVKAGAEEQEQGEPIVQVLRFGKNKNRIYAQHADHSNAFEVNKKVFDLLMAEFLTDAFWTFEPSQVVAFSSTQEGRTVGFKKDGDRWEYSADPDIPIDASKVKKHISQMKNLTTRRYVEYDGADLSKYGLETPATRITFELQDGTRTVLLVSDQKPPSGGGKQSFATLEGSGRVFLVSPTATNLGVIKLNRFESVGK